MIDIGSNEYGGVLNFRPLIESSDVLAKTPEEARKIVAQQLSSELARCRRLQKGQARYVCLGVEALRDYDNIEERTCVFELGGVEI